MTGRTAAGRIYPSGPKDRFFPRIIERPGEEVVCFSFLFVCACLLLLKSEREVRGNYDNDKNNNNVTFGLGSWSSVSHYSFFSLLSSVEML